MIHLKTYEQNEELPKVGDYIVCNVYKNNIGEIIAIYGRARNIIVRFEELDITTQISKRDIIKFSENKKDLDLILKTNIYNI